MNILHSGSQLTIVSKIMSNTTKAFILSALIVLLASCGSGGGDDSVVNQGVDGAPSLSNVELTSSTEGTFLTIGDTVTINITASEAILAPTVTVVGNAASAVSGSGTNWQATYVLKAGDASGELSFKIVYSDIAGNAGTPVTDATNSAFFTYSPFDLDVLNSDEFAGDVLSDDKWAFENGDGSDFGIPGWGNNELQIYSAEQASVKDGTLTITADKEPGAAFAATGGGYISARIRSKTIVDMSKPAGRVEVRAQLPEGQGIWPAIWMLPTQDVVSAYGIWPTTGEIDILEAVNLGVDGKQTIQSTLHYGQGFPDNSFDFTKYEPGVNPQDGFHTYAMEWNTVAAVAGVGATEAQQAYGEIRFYFDDKHFATKSSDTWLGLKKKEDGTYETLPKPAPFDKKFNILVNIAVGGGLPGNPDATTQFPQEMKVQFVRVFDCEADNVADCTVGKDSSLKAGAGLQSMVYDNSLNSQQWTGGISAFDEAISYESCTDDNGAACPSVNWEELDATDTARGKVIQVTYADDAKFAGMIIGQNLIGLNANSYADGSLKFDLNVISNPANAAFRMKVDCVDCPVNAGQREQSLGVPAVGWQEMSVNVADLIAASGGPSTGGLKIGQVTTGLVIFPEFGSTAGVQYQIDNIRWSEEKVEVPVEPEPESDDRIVNFQSDGSGVEYSLEDFEGNASEVITEGDNQLVQTTKTEGAKFYAGTIVTTSGLGIQRSLGNISIDVKSPKAALVVRMKLENKDDNTVFAEADVTMTKTDELETLTFDFSTLIDDAKQYHNIIVFFDFVNDVAGDGSVYQWDNISWKAPVEGTTPKDTTPKDTTVSFPISFNETELDYGLIDFGEAVTTSRVEADDNVVLSTTKVVGAATWAGTTVGGKEGLGASIVATGATTVAVDITSPKANIVVRLKIENSSVPEQHVFVDQTVASADTLSTLYFDFSTPDSTSPALDLSLTYDKISIFFDFDVEGDGTSYVWDNLRLEDASSSKPPAESGLDSLVYDGSLNAQWTDGIAAFDESIGWSSCVNDAGAGCPSVAWEEVAAVDTAYGQVLQVTYSADAQFAGMIVGQLATGIDASAYAGGTIKFDLNVISNPANAAFRMKVDCVDCPVDSGQREQSLGVPAVGWQEMSVNVDDMVNANGGPTVGGLKLGVVTTGLVIFPEFGSTAGVQYQIDNIRWSEEKVEVPVEPEPESDDRIVNFQSDGSGVEYSLEDFEGNASEVITEGDNQLVQTTKTEGAKFYAGTIVTTSGLGIQRSLGNISIDVKSPKAALVVRMKLENKDDNTVFAEADVTMTKTDELETLTFDFSTLIDDAKQYHNIIVFFDFVNDVAGDGSVYQWDNISWKAPVEGTTPKDTTVSFPISFNETELDYGLIDFGEAVTTSRVEADDNVVLSTTKVVGAATWAGTTVGGKEGLGASIVATGATTVAVDITSPKANIVVRLKIENSSVPEQHVFVDQTVASADTLSTLYFDFSTPDSTSPALDLSLTYDKISIFFDFDVEGDGTSYVWDNLRLEDASSSKPPAESGLDSLVYDGSLNAQWTDGIAAFDESIGWSSCVNDAGAGCPSVAWEEVAAVDTAYGQVLQVTYSADAQFAGMIVGQLATGIDASAYAGGTIKFDLNVISNPANAAFRMKVDCVDCPVDSGQREQSLGVPAVGWQEMSVNVDDMVNANGGPTVGGLKLGVVTTGLVIFPEFGSTAGVQYQIDNIRWSEEKVEVPVEPEPESDDRIVNFQSDGSGVEYSLEDFEGNASEVITEGDNQLVQTTKTEGAKFYAGTIVTTSGLGIQRSLGNISIDVKSPKAALVVRMKLENKDDNTVFAEADVTMTKTDELETLTFDFSTLIDDAKQYHNIIVFFDFVNDVAGDGSVYQWDNISWKTPVEDTTPKDTTVSFPISFNETELDYGLIDFGEAVTTSRVEADDNVVLSTTKAVGAKTWAGTTVGGSEGLGASIVATGATTVAVDITSPKANIVVRLKIENSSVAEQHVFVDQTVASADTLSTLYFDFSTPDSTSPALDLSLTYDKISIFFDFDVEGDGTSYVWDNLELKSAP